MKVNAASMELLICQSKSYLEVYILQIADATII